MPLIDPTLDIALDILTKEMMSYLSLFFVKEERGRKREREREREREGGGVGMRDIFKALHEEIPNSSFSLSLSLSLSIHLPT